MVSDGDERAKDFRMQRKRQQKRKSAPHRERSDGQAEPYFSRTLNWTFNLTSLSTHTPK